MRYLTLEEILGIHLRVIELTGGAQGLRDPNLLALVSEKPQLTLAGQEVYTTIFKKSAVYYQGLARGYAFTDGNKRTAYIAALTFLELNGYVTLVSNREAEDFTVRIVTENLEVAVIASWLERHIVSTLKV